MSPVGVVGLGPGSTATSAPGGHHHPHPHHHSHHPHQHGGGHGGRGDGGGGGGGGHGNSNGGQQPQRRPKIYCDKWVHEGVCAFTQQGCKYKHEMPFDKVTQHQLGLFHGFPAWWKKHQADLSRQRDGGGPEGADEPVRLSSDRFLGRGGGPGPGSGPSATPTPSGAPPVGGTGNADAADIGPGPAGQGLPSWRRNGGGESQRSSMVVGRGISVRNMRTPIGALPHSLPIFYFSQPNAPANRFSLPTAVSYGSPFGPIAPPVRTPTTPGAHSGNMGDAAYSGSSQSQQASENGNSVRPGAGIHTDNPYESLSMENGNGNYEVKPEVEHA